MLSKLHEFKIDAHKLICPTCKNEERDLGLDHTRDRNGKIIGAIISLQCRECYTRAEDILVITYLQPSEQSLVLTES
jgi:uncharacterized protein YbaR (Trm112 family)